MTFLHWLCTKLMGKAVSGSSWHCPVCGSPRASFSVRPPLPDKPVKYKCWRCSAWGDEYDLLKVFYPELNYPGRCRRLDELRAEYEQAAGPEQAAATTTFPSRGPGRGPGRYEGEVVRIYDTHPPDDEFSDGAKAAIAEIEAEFTEVLTDLDLPPASIPRLFELCDAALHAAAQRGLHPGGLAGRCKFEGWTRKLDYDHMASCDDPECEWRCCRLARGWTNEQIVAWSKAAWAEAMAIRKQKLSRN
jgi:hypothetical protein